MGNLYSDHIHYPVGSRKKVISGPATKRGGGKVRAWPLRKNTYLKI